MPRQKCQRVPLSVGRSADASAGVVGELDELAGDQVGRVVDEVSIHIEYLVGAVGIAQHVAGDGPQRIVRADLVDWVPSGSRCRAGRGSGFGFVIFGVVVAERPVDATSGAVGGSASPDDGVGRRQVEIGVGAARRAVRGRLRPIAGWSLRSSKTRREWPPPRSTPTIQSGRP